ncbi:MAG: hypothetical protein JRD89_00100 [Deltaproteobacteria bacterium]|nr:hypothetical protein [Deltaproteobacteria bacterium]
MGALTNRLTCYDVTVMDISGVSVLALFREASLEITIDEIDVSAAQDTWKQREFGQGDWRFTCTKLISGSVEFVNMALNRQPVIVSTDIGGVSIVGTGIITGVPINVGANAAQTEQITIVSAGSALSIG